MEEIVEKDMTPILLEDLGVIFLKETSKEKRRCGRYECQYCGKEFITKTKYIISGKTKSCGCLNRATLMKKATTHGLSKHRLYAVWRSLKARCYNENHKKYKDYGGRGIQVCDRWLDVGNFIEDMYPSFEEGLTLDRIDVNGNYEPDNCRWTTGEIQHQNTRDIICTNTSGYRGVSWRADRHKWKAYISVNSKLLQLGSFNTALEAAKAYETYVRLNNLEHNFTPALTEEEIEVLIKTKETQK